MFYKNILPVCKTVYEDGFLYFSKEDIIKACKLNNCSDELIEECLELVEEKEMDCTSCFMTLILELNCHPLHIFVEI